jgi:hypothetical protein
MGINNPPTEVSTSKVMPWADDTLGINSPPTEVSTSKVMPWAEDTLWINWAINPQGILRPSLYWYISLLVSY